MTSNDDLARSISSAVSEAVERSMTNALQNLEAGWSSPRVVEPAAAIMQQQTRAIKLTVEAYCTNLFLDCNS